MCEFCEKHGQGNRWYLNPDSYSDEMMADPARQKLIEEVCGYGIDYYIDVTSKVTDFARWPVLRSLVRMAARRLAPGQHGGQVVSLEDTLEIVSMARNFVLIPCACRRLVAHGDELCCLNFGPVRDMQRSVLPKGPMEEITVNEAREVLREHDRNGRIHQVLYAKVPMPICVCNCDLRWCTSFKQRVPYNIPGAVLKGHDVVTVAADLCDGCGGEVPCLERCGFGALEYDEATGRVRVDPGRCFGCGLCRVVCRPGALNFVARSGVPEAARSW
jgi:ferredoxin